MARRLSSFALVGLLAASCGGPQPVAPELVAELQCTTTPIRTLDVGTTAVVIDRTSGAVAWLADDAVQVWVADERRTLQTRFPYAELTGVRVVDDGAVWVAGMGPLRTSFAVEVGFDALESRYLHEVSAGQSLTAGGLQADDADEGRFWIQTPDQAYTMAMTVHETGMGTSPRQERLAGISAARGNLRAAPFAWDGGGALTLLVYEENDRRALQSTVLGPVRALDVREVTLPSEEQTELSPEGEVLPPTDDGQPGIAAVWAMESPNGAPALVQAMAPAEGMTTEVVAELHAPVRSVALLPGEPIVSLTASDVGLYAHAFHDAELLSTALDSGAISAVASPDTGEVVVVRPDGTLEWLEVTCGLEMVLPGS